MHDFFVNPRYIDLGSLAAQTMDLLITIYFFFGMGITIYFLSSQKKNYVLFGILLINF